MKELVRAGELSPKAARNIFVLPHECIIYPSAVRGNARYPYFPTMCVHK